MKLLIHSVECNRWSLGMDKQFHPTLYWACGYLSMLGLKLNHVSKRGYSSVFLTGIDQFSYRSAFSSLMHPVIKISSIVVPLCLETNGLPEIIMTRFSDISYTSTKFGLIVRIWGDLIPSFFAGNANLCKSIIFTTSFYPSSVIIYGSKYD